MSFRTYHEVTGEDRSRLGGQVAAQRAAVPARLRAIRHVVAIASGKGGVGKSWVTALLARALAARAPGGVGVLDADLASPTVARLLGARGPLQVTADGVQPARGSADVRVVSTELLLEEGMPLAWRAAPGDRFVYRGTLEAGVLREFLADVAWGPLDLLLVDLPPGTDRLQDLAGLAPALAGAVAVTLPTEEARRSVERAMHDARHHGVRLLGVVENMRAYACPACGRARPLFDGDAGRALARAFGVPLLATLPFMPGGLDDSASARAGDALAAALLDVLTEPPTEVRR